MKYSMTIFGPNLFRMNHDTGQTWILAGGEWYPINTAKVTESEKGSNSK